MACRKCNGTGTLLIRNEYCYCDECFISMINHKFRACLGKNKTLSPNEKVLVCLSGEASSTALLDLIHYGISLNNHKKLRIVPYFLHIIESHSEYENISSLLIEQCKKYNFNITIVNVKDYYETNIFCSEGVMINNHIKLSKSLLTNIPTSIRHDLVTKLKRSIYVKVSKELECKTVFTAETTTKLATKLLSNIAIGRGSQIEHDIGFADKRDENVKILRPMRDISSEEVEQYVTVKGLIPAKKRQDKVYETSLQSVIKDFVIDLQDNYPATISTVCKTADKISSADTNINKKKCVMCQSNIDYNNFNLTAVDATTFSRKVSLRQCGSNFYENKQTRKDDNNSMFPHIYQSLCYCCSRNISELNNPI